jgi:hypothetical protein
LVPVDYHGFHKVVSFTGGTVSGNGKTVPNSDLERLTFARESADDNEKLTVFKQYNRVTCDDHDHELMNGMVQEFFEQADEEEFRCWKEDYCVQVDIKLTGLRVLVNGRRIDETISNGTTVEFPIDPESTIPHYPLGNPHVLERPPTR